MHMIRMIIGQSILQLVVLLIISHDNSWASYVCDCETDLGHLSKTQKGAVFNAFVWLQIFNEINCRTIKEFDVFANFFSSAWFGMILVFTALMQLFMVELGGSFVGTDGISARYSPHQIS